MIRRLQLAVKGFLDFILGVVLMLLVLPLWVVVALLIKTEDKGPVFFAQERVGKDMRLFKMYKFRTMVIDADKYLDREGKPTLENRVTRIGKILRFLSIDELPQLINIIRGEMSLIGPRPMLPELFSRLPYDQRRLRMKMRPGVTGLAQVHGRNTLKWSKRIEYDIWYVENYSLWLDLKIFLKTIKVVLTREGIKLDRNPEEVDDLPQIKEDV